MKKLLLILGGVAMLFIAAVTFIAYFLLGTQEKERNRKKTEPMRAARWAPKETQEAEIVTEDNHKPTSEEFKTADNEKTE